MDNARPPRRGTRSTGVPRPLVPVPVMLGVTVIAIVTVIGLVYLGGSSRQEPLTAAGSLPLITLTSTTTAATPASAPSLPYEGKTKGTQDAPIEIIEYADFQCPACGAYAKGPAQQIDQAFVATGKVKITFRHYPFVGQESLLAALAAECANDQGRFWPYHDKLFASQAGENRGAFAPDKLKGFARDLGLDAIPFNGCLDSAARQDIVRADLDSGRQQAVRATPTFFMGTQKIEGSQSFETFQSLIAAELAKRG